MTQGAQGFSAIPPEVAPLVISRLKILADGYSRAQAPQDGNLQMEVNQERVNIRLSTLPTIYGEKLVLRLLRHDKIVMPWRPALLPRKTTGAI